jgi:hypothetical protein
MTTKSKAHETPPRAKIMRYRTLITKTWLEKQRNQYRHKYNCYIKLNCILNKYGTSGEVDFHGPAKVRMTKSYEQGDESSCKIKDNIFLGQVIDYPIVHCFNSSLSDFRESYFDLFQFRVNPKIIQLVDIMQGCPGVGTVFRKIWITQSNRM